MKYWTRDREAGNKIECFETLEEAQAMREEAEEEIKDGTFLGNWEQRKRRRKAAKG